MAAIRQIRPMEQPLHRLILRSNIYMQHSRDILVNLLTMSLFFIFSIPKVTNTMLSLPVLLVALSGRFDKISFDDYSSATGTSVYPSGVSILTGSQMTTTWRNGFFNNTLEIRHDSINAGIQFPKKSFDCFTNLGRNSCFQ